MTDPTKHNDAPGIHGMIAHMKSKEHAKELQERKKAREVSETCKGCNSEKVKYHWGKFLYCAACVPPKAIEHGIARPIK